MGKITEEFPRGFADDLPAIPAGWRADHWGNDACPSWVAFAHGDSPDDGVQVKVWVDHPDPDMREMDGPRYTVTVETYEGHGPSEEYCGDDWGAVLAAVAAATARLRAVYIGG